MNIDPQTAMAIVIPSITGLVWLLRLEGRVNMNEKDTKGLRKDVTYIRNRIDAALGVHFVRDEEEEQD